MWPRRSPEVDSNLYLTLVITTKSAASDSEPVNLANPLRATTLSGHLVIKVILVQSTTGSSSYQTVQSEACKCQE